MGSEYRESPPDANQEYSQGYRNVQASEPRQPEAQPGEQTFNNPQVAETPHPTSQGDSRYEDALVKDYQEPVYREHVSGFLGSPYSPPAPQAHNGFAPQQPTRPSYNGAQPQQPYAPYYPQGYYQPYGQHYYAPGSYGYPYGYYGYAQPAPKEPGRVYQLTMSIVTLVAASLTFLAGLFCLLVLIFTSSLPTILANTPEDQRFAVTGLFTAFSVAGIIGGITCGYHSIRAMLKKPSLAFKLPYFWIFLIFYVIVIGIAVIMTVSGVAVASTPLAIALIALAGIFPALTVVALAMRHIRKPQTAPWPTTWRRFIVALVSGATLSILLALILELLLEIVVRLLLGVSSSVLDSTSQLPSDYQGIIALLLTLAVIAPIVEEMVKPLAAIAMLGRMRNAAEAFIMGMGCGIGFGLVETVMYISSGYQDWLQVALLRSSACLLHGFGAGMVSLGWYYITHKNSTTKINRFLLGIGCAAYAVIQHSIWNGSVGLELLPFFPQDNFQVGPFSLSPDWAMYPIYLVLTILMIIFMLFVTRKLRQANREQAPARTPEVQGQPPTIMPQPAQIG